MLTRPIVYYAFSLYIGCISYVFYKVNSLLGAVVAASFLIIILLTINKKFSIIIMCFFTIGVVSTIIYYETAQVNNIEKVRIIKVSEFYSIGKINNRKIYIKGNLKGLVEGENIIVKGKFEPQKDYFKGTIGALYADRTEKGKSDVLSKIYEFKRYTFDKFSSFLGEDKSALVMSLCFGDANHLNEEQKASFKELGVVHAISVSGFHMAVIYKLLEGTIGFEAAIIFSFIYVIFTGAQAATVRSFLMILILKLSKKVFKNYDSLSALAFSAIILLINNPCNAVDYGFMLSYLATLGIILYYNTIRRTLYKLPKSINESLSLTISAQVFSMAFSGMAFGSLSFGFLPGNLILLPIYTIVVIAGNLALIVIKFQLAFKIVCKFIAIITIVLDGANYLLLKITPELSQVSYVDCIALLCLIICFILVKKGFSKYKYGPIFIIIMLIIQNYNFFPRIDYLNIGKKDGIIINYKFKRIYVGDILGESGHNLKVLDENYKFTEIVPFSDANIHVKLNKYCTVKISPLPNNKGDSLYLEVKAYNSNTIITRNSEEFVDIDASKYDIIKIPKKAYYLLNKVSILQSYNIIFNRVYVKN